MGKTETVDELRKRMKPFYEKQGSIYCKAIRDNVVFNSHGWKHLVRHSNGERRIAADSKMRLNLLSWVPEVVKHCRAPQLTNSMKQFFSGKELEVMYFELAKTFPKKGKRNAVSLVVVLRKIGDNPVHYWTVRYNKKAP